MTVTELITCSDCGASVTDSFDRLVAVCGSCRARWVALAVLGTPSRSTTASIATISVNGRKRLEAKAADAAIRAENRAMLGADYFEDDWDDVHDPVDPDVQGALVELQDIQRESQS